MASSYTTRHFYYHKLFSGFLHQGWRHRTVIRSHAGNVGYRGVPGQNREPKFFVAHITSQLLTTSVKESFHAAYFCSSRGTEKVRSCHVCNCHNLILAVRLHSESPGHGERV